jgi:hypothetical protein
MDLLIENGLMTKKLMGFEALGKLSEAEMKKKN